MTKAKPLSKSDYMLYLRHPAWLWYKKNQAKKLPAYDLATLARFEAGHKFEAYAEQLFEGVKLGFDNFEQYQSLPSRTAVALEKLGSVFQARFEHRGLTCICDVVTKKEDGSLDLYEIKSATRLKPEYIDDLAFQTIVLEGAGYSVDKIGLIYVNNAYQRRGQIEVDQITASEEITQKVRKRIPKTEIEIEAALEVMSAQQAPDPHPALASSFGYRDWLDVYLHLYPPKEASLFELGALGKRQLESWYRAGLESINQIDLDDSRLSKKQLWQLAAKVNGQAIIDKKAISKFLSSLEFPLYFLDYETMSSVLPYFDGQQPWKQYPFQYSLHRLETADGQLEHTAYLHTDNSEPSLAISQRLAAEIGEKGTVLAWYMPFEKGCNQTMATLQPEFEGFYSQLNQRMLDLMTPFASGWYKDHRFKASASIKNVLPVIVPNLSYKDLDIAKGDQAQLIWMETFLDGDKGHSKDKVAQDLATYCHLDTLAMVEIYQALRRSS